MEQLQVWRISLELDESDSGLGLAARRVATLHLGLDLSPTAISLCGNYIAWDYEKDGDLNVTTVDWVEAARSNGNQSHSSERPIPISTVKTRNVVHRAPDMVSVLLPSLPVQYLSIFYNLRLFSPHSAYYQETFF